jgi:hypothetical protein
MQENFAPKAGVVVCYGEPGHEGSSMHIVSYRHRATLLALCLSSPLAAAPEAARPGRSPAFALVTPGEALEWNAQPRGLRPDTGPPNCHAGTGPAPEGPQIKVLAPALGKPLNPPIDIDLQFVPAASMAVKPDTFRVCYLGFVTVDITKRITDRVVVSAQGLRVTGAQLPRGHHHLVLLVADEQGHLGRSEAEFDIQ